MITHGDDVKDSTENKTIYFVGLNGKLEKRNSTSKKPKSFIKELKEERKRVDVDKWNLSEDFLLPSKQLELIKELPNNNFTYSNNENKLIIQQIERKIYGYKQQDIIKNMLNADEFIHLRDIIEKLIACEMKCYYCNEEVSVLYEIVRENKQWTVDRIDNDLGHNINNYVIACLDCNLKRRRRSKDAYLFTKNLNIVKQDEDKK